MNHRIRLLAGLMLLAGCSRTHPAPVSAGWLPFYADPAFTPHWISPESSRLARFHRIPPFRLTNQRAELVTEATVEGKIYVANFMFTGCSGICPKTTRNLLGVQRAFAGDEAVRFLSHSVTPNSDTPETLRAFGDRYNIDHDQWDMVTGTRAEIYRLGRSAYFADEDLGTTRREGDFLHTENFILVDDRRYIRGVYNGLNQASVSSLVEDVRALKKEQAQLRASL